MLCWLSLQLHWIYMFCKLSDTVVLLRPSGTETLLKQTSIIEKTPKSDPCLLFEALIRCEKLGILQTQSSNVTWSRSVTVLNDWDSSQVDIHTTRLNHITDLSAQSHAFTLPNRRWLNVRNANWIGVNQVWNRRGVSFLPMSDKTKLHVGDRLSLKEISFPISGLFIQTKNNKCFVILNFFLRKTIRRESHLICKRRDSRTGSANKLVSVYKWRGQTQYIPPPLGSETWKSGGLIILRENCNILKTAMLNMSRNCSNEQNISAPKRD